MKKLLLPAFLCLVLFSCKKNDTVTATAPATSWIAGKWKSELTHVTVESGNGINIPDTKAESFLTFIDNQYVISSSRGSEKIKYVLGKDSTTSYINYPVDDNWYIVKRSETSFKLKKQAYLGGGIIIWYNQEFIKQ